MEGNEGVVDSSVSDTSGDEGSEPIQQYEDEFEPDTDRAPESDREDDEGDGTEIHQDKKPGDKPTAKAPTKPAPKERVAAKDKAPDFDPEKEVTLTVDGEKKTMKLGEALKRVQKEMGAEKKFGEAAQLRKRAEQVIDLAKNDPLTYLEKLGIDPLKLAKNLVAQQMEYEGMDEKDRQLLEYQRRVKTYQEREEREQQEKVKSDRELRVKAASDELDGKILEAFKKSGLPQKKFYMQHMAARLLGARQRDEDLLPEEAAAKVKESFFSDTKEVLDQMDAKAIREWLGPENIKKILESEVARVTAKSAPTATGNRPGNQPVPSTRTRKLAPLSEREWDAFMEKSRG